MSHNVSASFVELFESEVKQSFQEAGKKLRGSVRNKTGVVGKSVSFPVYGKGVAIERGASASDVKTMGTSTRNVEVLMKDLIAAEYSDFFDEAKLNFDDRQELAKVIAYALGRAEDQLIIDAVESATITNVVAANIEDGATDTGLTLTKVRRAKRLMDNAGTPAQDRYFVYTAGGLDALLADEKVGSVDYNNVKALVDGNIDTFLGFKFIMIADQTINDGAGTPVKTGLKGVGTQDRTYIAYHRDAIAYGIGVDMVSSAGWVEHKDSYLVKGKLMANAVVLDATGVVEINVKESL